MNNIYEITKMTSLYKNNEMSDPITGIGPRLGILNINDIVLSLEGLHFDLIKVISKFGIGYVQKCRLKKIHAL